MYKRHLGTWLSGGLGSAGLAVGPGGLRGLFQAKRFHDSVILLSPQRINPAVNAAFRSQSALEEITPGERLEIETESAEQEAAALLSPALPLLLSQPVQ